MSTTPAEAEERLWKATIAAEQGKPLDAMRAVGMTFEWLEDLTMDEALQVFQVRCADLRKIIQGNNQ